jgi:hypothetical protein
MSPQSGIAQWRHYPSWARGPARIVGDEVVLDEDRAQQSYIYEPADLMFELADLAADWDSRDTRDVLAFVRRNGLLWHVAEDLGTGECREPLSEWWIESRTLAVLMNLYADLKDSVKTGSADPLRRTIIDFTELFQANPPESDDQTLMEQASVYLAEAVTMKLEGCRMGLTSSVRLDAKPKGPGIFLLSQRPPNLLAAAYVHFAQAISNRAPMEECPGCGRMFIPESGKQKYCTKRCASTSRWRRWKARQDTG